MQWCPGKKPISQPNHLSSGISNATHRRHLLCIHYSRPFAGRESRHLPTMCCHSARLANTSWCSVVICCRSTAAAIEHYELWRPCIHQAAATTPTHDTSSQRQLSCTKLVKGLKPSIHVGYRDNTPSRHPFTTPIILYKARERPETQYSCGLQRQHPFTTPLHNANYLVQSS